MIVLVGFAPASIAATQLKIKLDPALVCAACHAYIAQPEFFLARSNIVLYLTEKPRAVAGLVRWLHTAIKDCSEMLYDTVDNPRALELKKSLADFNQHREMLVAMLTDQPAMAVVVNRWYDLQPKEKSLPFRRSLERHARYRDGYPT